MIAAAASETPDRSAAIAPSSHAKRSAAMLMNRLMPARIAPMKMR